MAWNCNALSQKELLRREPVLLKRLSCLSRVYVLYSSSWSSFSVLHMIDASMSDSSIVYSVPLQFGVLACCPACSAANRSSAFIHAAPLINNPQEYATSLLWSSWALGWWGASRDVQEAQSQKDSAFPIVHQCPYFNPLILHSNLQSKPIYFINLFTGEYGSDLYPMGLVLTLWDFRPSSGSGQKVLAFCQVLRVVFHTNGAPHHKLITAPSPQNTQFSVVMGNMGMVLQGQMPLLVKSDLVLWTGFCSFTEQQFCVFSSTGCCSRQGTMMSPQPRLLHNSSTADKGNPSMLDAMQQIKRSVQALVCTAAMLGKVTHSPQLPGPVCSPASYLETRLLVYICYTSLDCIYTQQLFNY